MPTTVFYSWQSDRPEKDCRYFIEDAIKAALKALARDAELQNALREPVTFDKDTMDEPGFVKIFETILEKIEKATVFVTDLTFVATRPKGEPTPNPNVLIEYGYALKAFGEKGTRRVIAVMNIAYGEPTRENMPFDLLGRRNAVTYNLPGDADSDTRSARRKELIDDLTKALRVFFASDFYRDTQPKPPAPPLRELRRPKFGEARFRTPTEAIGTFQDMESQFLGTPQPKGYFLNDGPAMWLRVTTNLAPLTTLNITELNRRIGALGTFPLSALGGANAIISSSDGCGICLSTNTEKTPNLVFVFKDGEVWAINTFSLQNRQQLIILDEPIWARSLQAAAEFLNAAGFPGPYRWIAGMEGVNGRYFMPKDALQRKFGPCLSDIPQKEGIFNLEDDPAKALEPFFELVWDQCQVERPKNNPSSPATAT